jgi:hypothetical protein
MPPIELFAGLEAVRASTAVDSGLPTRKQLDQWLIEHEKIEKETEIFDSGELKKFKNFTMGQYRAVFFSLSSLLIEIVRSMCSGLEAQFITPRYGCHRDHFDDHIRIRQTPTPPARQV